MASYRFHGETAAPAHIGVELTLDEVVKADRRLIAELVCLRASSVPVVARVLIRNRFDDAADRCGA